MKANYIVSEDRKFCNFNIHSEKDCQKASKKFRFGNKNLNATYSIIKGKKNVLPEGCIFDSKIPLQPHVYWNPKGTEDLKKEHTRTHKICKNAPFKSKSRRESTLND